jgi:hypothetical protein
MPPRTPRHLVQAVQPRRRRVAVGLLEPQRDDARSGIPLEHCRDDALRSAEHGDLIVDDDEVASILRFRAHPPLA